MILLHILCVKHLKQLWKRNRRQDEWEKRDRTQNDRAKCWRRTPINNLKVLNNLVIWFTHEFTFGINKKTPDPDFFFPFLLFFLLLRLWSINGCNAVRRKLNYVKHTHTRHDEHPIDVVHSLDFYGNNGKKFAHFHSRHVCIFTFLETIGIGCNLKPQPCCSFETK